MMSHEAEATHSEGLCMPKGWKLAIGPVMNTIQENPALMQGQAFPWDNGLEWK